MKYRIFKNYIKKIFNIFLAFAIILFISSCVNKSDESFVIKEEKEKVDYEEDPIDNNLFDISKVKTKYNDIKEGDYIKFGCYREYANGVHEIEDTILYWRVLDIKDGKALLHLRDNISNEETINIKDLSVDTDIKWEDNSARLFLNDVFLENSFTKEEIDCVIDTNIKEDKDKIFLLSVDEMIKYYKDITTRPKGSALRDDSRKIKKYKAKKHSIYQAWVSYYGTIDEYKSGKNGICPAMWVSLDKLKLLEEDRETKNNESVYYEEEYKNTIITKDNDDYYIDDKGLAIKIFDDIDDTTDGDIVYFAINNITSKKLPFYVNKRHKDKALICSMFTVNMPVTQDEVIKNDIINNLLSIKNISKISTSSVINNKIITSDELNIREFNVYSKRLKDYINFGVVDNITYKYDISSFDTRICFEVNVEESDEYKKEANGFREYGRKEVKNPRLFGLYYIKDFEIVKNKTIYKDGVEYYLDEDGLANEVKNIKELKFDYVNREKEDLSFTSLFINNSPYAYEYIKEGERTYFTDKIGRKNLINDDIFKAKIGESVYLGKYEIDGENKDILWRVVNKKTNNDIVLMSEYEFDYNDGLYQINKEKNSYKNSHVRKWLNDEFYNKAFTDEDKTIIRNQNVNIEYFIGSSYYDSNEKNTIKDHVYTVICSMWNKSLEKSISKYYANLQVSFTNRFHFKRGEVKYSEPSAFGKIRPYITINKEKDKVDKAIDELLDLYEKMDEEDDFDDIEEFVDEVSDNTVSSIMEMFGLNEVIDDGIRVDDKSPIVKDDIKDLSKYLKESEEESKRIEEELLLEEERKNEERIKKEYIDSLPEKVKELYKEIKNKHSAREYKDIATVDYFDTIKLGKYEQDNNIGNGPEDIEWIILKKEDDKVLLLSKYILDYKYYNEDNEKTFVTWENSTIREWLNTKFYNTAFSEDEYDLILDENIKNGFDSLWLERGRYDSLLIEENKRWNATDYQSDTKDKIFLPSLDEVNYAFYNDDIYDVFENRKSPTKPTEFAKNIILDNNKIFVDTSYEWSRGNSDYFLRTSGAYKNTAVLILQGGSKLRFASILKDNNQPRGIRPAMWISYVDLE